MMGKREMGRWFSTDSFDSLLWIGVTSADFQSEGIQPEFSERLNRQHSLGAI